MYYRNIENHMINYNLIRVCNPSFYSLLKVIFMLSKEKIS